ncbi:MAG: L-lactate dehydrogenase [Acidobacteriota bacterium]
MSDEPVTLRHRLAVVGAGAVGSTIAYAAMLKGLVREIVLIDVAHAKAEAEAKDLMHGSLFVPPVEVMAGTLADCRGAGIVVITAGAKQKPGQSRLELVSANTTMLKDMIPRIQQAAPGALLLLVSNPVDVLTYVAWKVSSLPPSQVMGSGTVLDTSRFRALLARRLKVAVNNVHAYIVGEHGDSEVPLWSSAQVGNVSLETVSVNAPALTDQDRREIFHNVREAAAQVIAAKGATNWAVGLAVARILEAVLRDEQAILTVSGLLHDYHGIDDVCASVPRLVGGSGLGTALPLSYDATELAALRRSAGLLREVLRQVGF